MRNHLFFAPVAPVAALVAVLAGCEAKVASVELSPAKVSLRSDSQTQKLTATPKDAEGAAIEGERPVAWTSADPAVATVDAQGVVKPTGSGKTTITATIDEHAATAEVDVLLVKAIRLPSLAAVVVVGTPSPPFAVVFTNEKGEPVTPDPALSQLTWKTENAAVATVSDTGVVTGVAAGSTTLTVSTKELKAEMTITVNPAPEGAPADGAATTPGTAPGTAPSTAPGTAPGGAAPTK
jgi:uncharacterized protein YjdB